MTATSRSLRRLVLDLECLVLRRIDRLALRFGPARHRPRHLVLGEQGEREALFALRREGYTVVARRWRSPKARGDVDLIAWEGDRLCFVEVKTRASRNPLDPAETAVDHDKQRVLRRLADLYLRSFPGARRDRIATRFDVIAVYFNAGAVDRAPEVDLFRNAFHAG